MADRLFSDWESLISACKGVTSSILKKEVAPVAEEILKKHIQSDIYGVYTPKEGRWVNGTTYQRRHVLESGITSIYPNNDTLLVTSVATASPSVVKGYSFKNRQPGAFLKLLETGNMGIWRNGFPRPAVANTEKEFDGSPEINRAILQGIERTIGKSDLI